MPRYKRGKSMTIETVIQLMSSLKREHEGKIKDALQEISEHTVERARENAPILTGALREGLTADKPVRNGSKIIARLRDTTPYSLKQHEELGPPTVNPQGWMNLGPVSVQQPTTPEGGVGGKFIERVAQYHHDSYTETLVSALEQVGSEKPKRKVGRFRRHR